MTQLVTTTTVAVAEYTNDVAERIARQKRRSAKSEAAAEIADQDDEIRNGYGSSISVQVDSTDALKALQERIGIEEETVREMQEDAGLSRLHSSRRQEFVEEILSERVADAVDSERIEREAAEKADRLVSELFDRDGGTITLGWTRKDSGNAVRYRDDHDDVVVSVENATNDFSGIPGRSADVAVLKDGSEISVETSFGSETRTLDTGLYRIQPRHIRDLAEDLGLIEIESREASCSSADEEALDIDVGRGESDSRAHVIELQNGDGGYSSRHTKGWTEYRDIDMDQEMVLIVVGQASYYKGSARGKSERAWLVGHDDSQIWAQQVYTTHESVREALDFVVPGEVQRLQEEGRETIRQGDFYFVEMKRSSNLDALEGSRHEIEDRDEDAVTVTHPEHEDLELTGAWKAVENNDGSQSSSSSRRRVVRD